MKILKPGKVEQRKFVCAKCGCVFVADEKEAKKLAEPNCGASMYPAILYCADCPCGTVIMWEDGEPYEEPERDVQSDALRLYKLMKGTWPYSIGELEVLSTFLADNGVTFKEE